MSGLRNSIALVNLKEKKKNCDVMIFVRFGYVFIMVCIFWVWCQEMCWIIWNIVEFLFCFYNIS